jgi:hypothetical protein
MKVCSSSFYDGGGVIAAMAYPDCLLVVPANGEGADLRAGQWAARPVALGPW